MTRQTHDRLLGIGFTLAYLGAMSVLLLSEVARLAPIRSAILLGGSAPAILLGVVLLATAHIVRISDDPGAPVARDP